MSEREQYQQGVPCWVDSAQPDPQAAIGFYGDLLGWQFAGPGVMPGDPPGQYFVAQLRGRDVAGISSLPPQEPTQAPAWNTYVSVHSADDTAERARSAGGAVVVSPFDALPAGRMAVLRDPGGALFCAWEAKDRQGAQLVNEPSAWSMSLLSTRDPDAAKAFYGAVFGWESETLGAEMTLWRLPGYVGGEPQQPVARDVVGVMTAVSDDDVSPHWGVDFWIGENTDAVAAKAVRLGGAVIVPPHDAPGFRSAVLADPQGAAFSVSKLMLGR
jgi:uncharacterized protein